MTPDPLPSDTDDDERTSRDQDVGFDERSPSALRGRRGDGVSRDEYLTLEHSLSSYLTFQKHSFHLNLPLYITIFFKFL